MRLCITAALLFTALVLCPVPLMAQAQGDRPVKFAGEDGVKRFLENEPEPSGNFVEFDDYGDLAEPPRRGAVIQRPLIRVDQWREATAPRFAFHVTPTQHFLSISLDDNLFGQFYPVGTGAEFGAYLHVDKGVDAFLAVEWSYHPGGTGDVGGLRTELTDFTMTTVSLGLKPFISLKDILGSDDAFSRSFHFQFRFGVGAGIFEGVHKTRPVPESTFWNPGTMGSLQIAAGIEYTILTIEPFGELSFMAEQALRFYTPPNASSSERPDNEVGPLGVAVFQVGLFFRMRFF